MLKKGLFVVLAALAAFALVTTGCPSPDNGGKPDPEPVVDQITISYDLNLDSGVSDAPAKPSDVKINKGGVLGVDNLPDLTPPAGFEFLGWSLAKTDSASLLDGSETFSANTIIFAQWITANEIKVYFIYNYRNAPAPKLVLYARNTDLGTENDPAAREGYTFEGWYDNARGTGTKYTSTSKTPQTGASLTLYADWAVVDAGAPGEILSTDAIKDDKQEWLALDNGFYAVYQFTLPEGARWADYKELSAEYLITEGYWDVPNTARGSRLMGNFKLSDFKLVDWTSGSVNGKIAVSNYSIRNATHIMDTTAGDWKTVRDVAAYAGATLAVDEYFTLTYKIDASQAYIGFSDANLPDPMAKGPFYFALGITGQGGLPGGTVQKLKNIKLTAVTAATGAVQYEDVYAVPLYLKGENFSSDPDDIYPAFTGYESDTGGYGVKEAYRSVTSAPAIDPPEAAAEPATEDFSVTLEDGALINSSEFTGNYDSSADLFALVTFPDGLNASSYAKFTIEAEFYSDDPSDADNIIELADGLGSIVWSGAEVQSDWYDEKITTTYNLGSKTVNADIPAAIRFYPSRFMSVAFQNTSADVKFIRITEITFHAKTE